MNLAALMDCLTSTSCLVTQTTSGLIIGMLLFLVAAGLTLIFGVLKVVNFTHGSFYMIGAYLALTVNNLTDSYFLAVLAAAAGVGLFALVFERFFMSKVYGSNVLMQLLVCYAFILILDDAVKIIWGPEFKSMGMADGLPEAAAVHRRRHRPGLLPLPDRRHAHHLRRCSG